MEPDDPRCARHALRDRLVLRVGLPAARRRTSAPGSGSSSRPPCLSGFMVLLSISVDHDRDAAEQSEGSPARVEGRRGRERPVGVEDRSGAEHHRRGNAGGRRGARAAPARDRRRARARTSPKASAEPEPQQFAKFGAQHRLPHRLRGLPDVRHRWRLGPHHLLARTQVRGRRVLRDARRRARSRRSASRTDVRPARGPALRRPAVRLRVAAPAAWVYFGISLVLFALFLLGLHWYEKDARERAKQRDLRRVRSRAA